MHIDVCESMRLFGDVGHVHHRGGCSGNVLILQLGLWMWCRLNLGGGGLLQVDAIGMVVDCCVAGHAASRVPVAAIDGVQLCSSWMGVTFGLFCDCNTMSYRGTMWLCSMAVVEAPWWHRGGCMCALNSCVCMAYPQQASCLTWTCVHALSPDGCIASI